MDIPKPPEELELKNIIDKLAQFVARNGPEFEQMTKNKQRDNPRFQFLFGGPYFNYYQYKVTTEQAILKQKIHRESQQQNQYQYGSMVHHQQGDHVDQGMTQEWMPPHHEQPYQDPQQMQQSYDYFVMQGPGPQGPGQPSLLGHVPGFPAHGQVDIAAIQQQIDALRVQESEFREQLKQSEINLAAQETSLMTQQKLQTNEACKQALADWLVTEGARLNIDLNTLDNFMQPIQQTCTKDSIANGKAWIFSNVTDEEKRNFLTKYLTYRGIVPGLFFLERLHLVYLVNDVLHHCVRKNCEELKQALEDAVVPMFCFAATVASEEEMQKLEKLKNLWHSRSASFTPGILEMLENPQKSVEEMTEKLQRQFANVAASTAAGFQSTFEGYKHQHQLFTNHVTGQIEALEEQIRQLEAQVNQSREVHHENYDTNGYRQLDKQWDVDDYDNEQEWLQSESGFHDDYRSNYQPELEGIEPALPYYDLPAGLMVTMIKAEDTSYKPLDPKKIRLPAPVPPSERLIKAVTMFYAPPSHERPRDSDGWEKLALYEYYKAKTQAKRDKEKDIEEGRREKSPIREKIERPTTPVPEKPKLRYSSVSPDASPVRSRSPSRSPSPKKREKRSRSRSPIAHKKKSPVRDLRRSPTPPSFGVAFKTPEQRIDESNRGHQLLKKMGWGGAGLGSQEQGIAEPISGGEVRDRVDMYKGVGVGSDPFEEYRKNRGNQFIARMRSRDEEKKALLGVKGKEGK